MLEFDSIGKSFFGVAALKGVTFCMEAGSTLGLIGENGAGKSTLMNVLGGVTAADTGRMSLFGIPYRPSSPAEATRAGIAFIHQELNLFPNLSIADNLFIDSFPRIGRLPLIHKRRTHGRAEELLGAVDLHLAPGTPVEMLTPGERQLVEIARALGQDARVIIFDEPTTSLTAAERQRLFQTIGRLRDQGRTIVYVSHVLDDVLMLSDTIAVLRDGCLVSVGPRGEYSVDRMISEMVGRRVEQMYPTRHAAPGSGVVLQVRKLTQPGTVKDVSFGLHEKEILGVFGLMGSGRSELARIIFGLDPFESGIVKVGEATVSKPLPRRSIRNRMAFVTENRREEGLLMDASVSDNLDLLVLTRCARFGAVGVIDRAKTLALASHTLSRLQIRSGPIDRQPAKHLSGGNQQKVVIGRWILTDPAVLILDEPTRGIDVGAKCEIYGIISRLAEDGTGILYISSELEELIGMCDRILVMSNGRIQAAFDRTEFDQQRILYAAFQGRTGHKDAGDDSKQTTAHRRDA